jgi:hypothetical protein
MEASVGQTITTPVAALWGVDAELEDVAARFSGTSAEPA